MSAGEKLNTEELSDLLREVYELLVYRSQCQMTLNGHTYGYECNNIYTGRTHIATVDHKGNCYVKTVNKDTLKAFLHLTDPDTVYAIRLSAELDSQVIINQINHNLKKLKTFDEDAKKRGERP
jgi:hypothetical protein